MKKDLSEGGQFRDFFRFRRLRVCPTFPDLAFISRSWKGIRWVRGVWPTEPMRRLMSKNSCPILIVSIFICNTTLRANHKTSNKTCLSMWGTSWDRYVAQTMTDETETERIQNLLGTFWSCSHCLWLLLLPNTGQKPPKDMVIFFHYFLYLVGIPLTMEILLQRVPYMIRCGLRTSPSLLQGRQWDLGRGSNWDRFQGWFWSSTRMLSSQLLASTRPLMWGSRYWRIAPSRR